jgi:hypothetical protein
MIMIFVLLTLVILKPVVNIFLSAVMLMPAIVTLVIQLLVVKLNIKLVMIMMLVPGTIVILMKDVPSLKRIWMIVMLAQ